MPHKTAPEKKKTKETDAHGEAAVDHVDGLDLQQHISNTLAITQEHVSNTSETY